MEGSKQSRGKYASLLFILLLFFSLGLCSLFTVLIGAQVYENINGRMEDNFKDQTALSYISNKVKQSDIAGAVSVQEIEETQVLVLEQMNEGRTYQTMIYCLEGEMRELFTEKDSGLGLADGIAVLPSDDLRFTKVGDRLIKVEMGDASADSLFLGTRSEAKN